MNSEPLKIAITSVIKSLDCYSRLSSLCLPSADTRICGAVKSAPEILIGRKQTKVRGECGEAATVAQVWGNANQLCTT